MIHAFVRPTIHRLAITTNPCFAGYGAQFITRNFREYIKLSGLTYVRTSPSDPQSNGKIERWHQTLKNESIRQKVPLSLASAIKIIEEFTAEYNGQRLHSAISYITPNDKMNGKAEEIWRTCDEKSEVARKARKTTQPKEVCKVSNNQIRPL